jgi:putative acetyltransferase
LKSTDNAERWMELVREQYVIKACFNDEIVGFASLKQGNYVDFLYVHGNHQGKGIAQQLLNALLVKAKIGGAVQVTSDVSFTAKPFFKKNGFKSTHKNDNKRGSEVLVNFRMFKNLD